jgi:hypothetical protein
LCEGEGGGEREREREGRRRQRRSRVLEQIIEIDATGNHFGLGS